MKIKSLNIKKLFGIYDYNLNFYDDINIFYGDNGKGKTTILNIIANLLKGDIERFNQLVFDSINLTFDNGNYIELKLGDKKSLILSYEINNESIKNKNFNKIKVNYLNLLEKNKLGKVFLPTYRLISSEFEEINKIYNKKVIKEIVSEITEIPYGKFNAISDSINIKKFNNELTKKFPTEELMKNALDNVELEKEQIEEITKLFKDKLNNFINIINECFSNTKKKLTHSKSINIAIVNENDINIEIGDLSSGEKNILLIFYSVIFQMDRNAFFLIDAPELSLHPSWQLVLLDKIKELIPNKQIFVATHSPDIAHYNINKTIKLDDSNE